jgi:hypothetical protein
MDDGFNLIHERNMRPIACCRKPELPSVVESESVARRSAVIYSIREILVDATIKNDGWLHPATNASFENGRGVRKYMSIAGSNPLAAVYTLVSLCLRSAQLRLVASRLLDLQAIWNARD